LTPFSNCSWTTAFCIGLSSIRKCNEIFMCEM
jgi:hypothetical protein